MLSDVEILKQQIQQAFSQTPADNEASDYAGGLTCVEREYLFNTLSGMAVSSYEPNLKAPQEQLQSLVSTKTQINNQNEVFCNADNPDFSDKIKYYLRLYPQAVTIRLVDENIVLLDKYNNPITDYLQIFSSDNRENRKNAFNQNYAQFYLMHNNNELSVNKFLSLQKLQEQIDSVTPNDLNYEQIIADIEEAKMGLIAPSERENYIVNTVSESLNNNPANFLIILGIIFKEKCHKINELYNPQTNYNFYNNISPVLKCIYSTEICSLIKEFTILEVDNMNAKNIIAQMLKLVDTELDKLIENPMNMKYYDEEFLKQAVAEIPRIGHTFKEALEPYSLRREDKNSRQKHITFEDFTLLEIPSIRALISDIEDYGTLKKVIDFIEKSSFTKAEKQMLNNECIKQQGILQQSERFFKTEKENDIISDEEMNTEAQQLSKDKVLSHIAYQLSNICEKPAQRELANFILSDSRIYSVPIEDLKEIVRRTDSPEDFILNQQFIEKLLECTKKDDDKENVLNLLKPLTNNESKNLRSLKIKLLDKFLQFYTIIPANKILDFMQNLSDEKTAEFLYEQEFLWEEPNVIKPIKSSDKLTKKLDILNGFMNGRTYSEEDIGKIISYVREYKNDILTDICKKQDFSAQQIVKIMDNISEDKQLIVNKIINAKGISSQEKTNIILQVCNKNISSDVAENLLKIVNGDIGLFNKILKDVTYFDANQQEFSYSENLKTYMEILNNPAKLSLCRYMLKDGWDINTICKNAEQMHEFDENFLYHKDFNLKLCKTIGLTKADSEFLIKTITDKNINNKLVQQAAFKLLNAGIPLNETLELLSFANASGEYNSQIIDDAILLNKMGLVSFLGKNITLLNNLTVAQLSLIYSEQECLKLRKQLLSFSNNKKTILTKYGISIEDLLVKLGHVVKEKSQKVKT